jgi:hypothetical protein
VTPVALSVASASLIQPPTPVGTPAGTPQPVTADLSGTLYCGYAGEVLYFAGTVLDDVLTADVTYQTQGALSLGDAVRITLDGAGDGLADVRGDDHDLYISPGGQVRDFDSYPISTTVSIGATAGGWVFELALEASELEIGALGSGVRWGLVWHLLDADDAGGSQHVLDDRKRWATVP